MAGKSVDFLGRRSEESLRNEITNLVDSYSNPWDVLAELAQNAVDAIRRHIKQHGKARRHSIKVVIDAGQRRIEVRDTGTGIQPVKLADLMAPNSGDKRADPDQIGEKGVGLTYTIFSCDHYSIRTKSSGGTAEGQVQGGVAWRQGQVDGVPQLDVATEDEPLGPDATGTTVELRQVEQRFGTDEDVFSMSMEVLQWLLRTRTAIGWLKGVWGEEVPDIEVTLERISATGQSQEAEVPFRYMLPSELLKPSDVLDLEQFKKEAAALDDTQKAKRLSGKALTSKGSVERAGRTINYWTLFVPSREIWTEASKKNQLVSVQEGGTVEPLVWGGIYSASKGMPTGITIDPPATGYSGYWPNTYMVLEDDLVVFDLGRKSIPPATKGMLKGVAKNVFNEFMPFNKYAVKDPVVITGPAAFQTKATEFAKIENLAELGLSQIKYLKHPNDQEAAVVAIFHELIGAGLLKGYRIARTGYRQTYDSWGFYDVPAELIGKNVRPHDIGDRGRFPVVIEFKYRAESILKDVEDNRKHFMELDLIVCWDIDPTRFAKDQVQVTRLDRDDAFFFGSNYELEWPGAMNLGQAGQKPVLALRPLIERMAEETD